MQAYMCVLVSSAADDSQGWSSWSVAVYWGPLVENIWILLWLFYLFRNIKQF